MFNMLGLCQIDGSVSSGRISSWDRSGANKDARRIEPGEKLLVAELSGAGIIKHIWMTAACDDVFYLRKLVLRMFWDDSTVPGVEVPLGDFFGVGHARVSHYVSLLTNMVTDPKRLPFNAAMNCFFPMPFAAGARIEVENECEVPVESFYYYVNYERHPQVSDDLGRFHALWRRENPCDGWLEGEINPDNVDEVFQTPNLSDAGNYVILDVRGKGQYIGCNLSVHNLAPNGGWFGEGDDMIFIDGSKWPPDLHGTGTEDYFCAAWGFPSGAYSGPFHGISLAGDTNDYSGQWTVYRYHLESPIRFNSSIRVSIEHGHANSQSDDWASTAYWYQLGTQLDRPPLPTAFDRLPRVDEAFGRIADEIVRLYPEYMQAPGPVRQKCQHLIHLTKIHLGSGRYDEAEAKLHVLRQLLR